MHMDLQQQHLGNDLKINMEISPEGDKIHEIQKGKMGEDPKGPNTKKRKENINLNPLEILEDNNGEAIQ